jgi:hypothetical protein
MQYIISEKKKKDVIINKVKNKVSIVLKPSYKKYTIAQWVYITHKGENQDSFDQGHQHINTSQFNATFALIYMLNENGGYNYNSQLKSINNTEDKIEIENIIVHNICVVLAFWYLIIVINFYSTEGKPNHVIRSNIDRLKVSYDEHRSRRLYNIKRVEEEEGEDDYRNLNNIKRVEDKDDDRNFDDIKGVENVLNDIAMNRLNIARMFYRQHIQNIDKISLKSK